MHRVLTRQTAYTAALALCGVARLFAQGATDSWKTAIVRDKLTGKPTVLATQSISVQDRAKMLVTASCGIAADAVAINSIADNQRKFLTDAFPINEKDAKGIIADRPKLDTRALGFAFKYAPSTAGVSLRQSQIAQHVVVNRAGYGTVSPPRSCTFLRVMVGDHGREGVESLVCDHENEASIGFSNFHATDASRTMFGRFGAQAGNDALGQMLGNGLDRIMDAAAQMTDITIATIDEVFNANDLRVELPLTNDDSILIEIRPQHSSFKEFVASCNREFPPPPPSQPIASRPAPKPPTDPLALPKPQPEPAGPVYTRPSQPASGFSQILKFGGPFDYSTSKDGMTVRSNPQEIVISKGQDSYRVGYDPSGRMHDDGKPGWYVIDQAPNKPLQTIYQFDGAPPASVAEIVKTAYDVTRTTGTLMRPGFAELQQWASMPAGPERAPVLPKPLAPSANSSPIISIPTPGQKPDNPLMDAANRLPPGLAVLTIHSGFAGQPNPLAHTRFYLMPDDFVTTLTKVGIRVPAGIEPSAAFRDICRGEVRCENNLVRASTDHAATLAVSDANGDARIMAQPGEYYLRIYGFDSGKRHMVWNEKIVLTPGANSFTADTKNAKRLP